MDQERLTLDPEKSLAGKLRWLMFFRLVITTFLLGTTAIVQLREVGPTEQTGLTALYILIGATYFLTFIYALVLPRLAPVTAQAYIQITGDVFFATAIIYVTGGIESIFSFIYILGIINAGILLYRRGGMITASLSLILYGTLLDFHYYGYISPYATRLSFMEHYRPVSVLNTILVNGFAFYLVAYLSSYLSSQVEESRAKLAVQESELIRLEHLNESIIQSIDSGLMTLGPKGEVLSFNPAAERITGFTFGQVRGRSYAKVFSQLALPADLASGPPPNQPWTLTYSRADGQELSLEMALLGLKDDSGADWGRLLVFQDKTRIRQMEEDVKRIEKLAAVGELAAGIAHEIRNPLASMGGAVQMLEAERGLGPDQQRLLEIIRREMERLDHIVNDFLLFARPRVGEPARVNLSRTIEDTLNIFQHQAGLNQKIRLVREIAPDLFIHFDPHQLEQVLWNLLHNAAEAMPEGGVLSVVLEANEAEPALARVRVSDTGVGIAPADRHRIFNPFYTTKDQGSGLGLAIVRRILESGGGRIEVTSAPGQGTTFTVRLPLDK